MFIRKWHLATTAGLCTGGRSHHSDVSQCVMSVCLSVHREERPATTAGQCTGGQSHHSDVCLSVHREERPATTAGQCTGGQSHHSDVCLSVHREERPATTAGQCTGGQSHHSDVCLSVHREERPATTAGQCTGGRSHPHSSSWRWWSCTSLSSRLAPSLAARARTSKTSCTCQPLASRYVGLTTRIHSVVDMWADLRGQRTLCEH